MSNAAAPPPRLPPPWFVHTAWRAHRALYRLSGGRFLWTTSNRRGWGALRLTTIGRKSGQERSVIIGYVEDGPNLVALAMNGWDEGHPSWWLNLEAALGRGRSEAGRVCRPAVDRDPRDRPRTARRDRLTPGDDIRLEQADNAISLGRPAR
jgi:deazaflavin-dependent oxidoreductase (nitroreductase family)